MQQKKNSTNQPYFPILGKIEDENSIIPVLKVTNIGDQQFTFETNPKLIVPSEVFKTWNDLLKVTNKKIVYYEKNNQYSLWCESDKKAVANKEVSDDLSRYILAHQYILALLLIDEEISIDSPEEKKAFNIINNSIFIRNIWLRYYLLQDSAILDKFGLKPPKARQYQPGKVEFKHYEYIKELWLYARNNPNSLCQWMLAFESPAQIWLGLEVFNYYTEWERTLTPKAIKGKEKAYKEEKEVLDIMSNSYDNNEIKSSLDPSDNLADSPGEKKYYINFQEALFVTFSLFEKIYGSEGHLEIVKARQQANNYRRKGGEKIQLLRTNSKGNLLLGKSTI